MDTGWSPSEMFECVTAEPVKYAGWQPQADRGDEDRYAMYSKMEIKMVRSDKGFEPALYAEVEGVRAVPAGEPKAKAKAKSQPKQGAKAAPPPGPKVGPNMRKCGPN